MRLATRRRRDWMYGEFDGSERLEWIELPGATVEVSRLGRGAPLVIVPGLAGGARLLRTLTRYLAIRHEVIIVGLRGDSRTSQAAGDIADYAMDLGRVMDILGLDLPMLMGVSFGGAVALELAATHPERISGLILQGVDARYQANIGSRIALAALEHVPLPSHSAFLNQFFNILFGHRPEPGPLVDLVIESCLETNQARVAERIRLLHDFDVRDRLWRIEAPALVIGGERDVVIPRTRGQALAEALPHARYVEIAGGGHVAFVTHAMEIALTILRSTVALSSLEPVESKPHRS